MTAEVFIPLTRGRVAAIDFDDFEKKFVRTNGAFRRLETGFYTRAGQYTSRSFTALGHRRTQKTVLMHRIILGKSGLVDHINGDTLDNRRKNLRPASRSQNGANQKVRSSNRSGFKGVNWKKPGPNFKKNPTGKWAARISLDNRRIHIGYFSTAEEAAKAYDTAAKTHFGEFAKPNFS